MKNTNYTLIVCFLFTILYESKLFAQIVLEQNYDSSAYNFTYVKMQHYGEKYVVAKTKSNNFDIKFYNLNHSLWKSITNVAVPVTAQPSFGISATVKKVLFVSDSLFAVDTLVEFMYTVHYPDTSSGIYFTKMLTYVYNENGVQLFFDSLGIYDKYYQGMSTEYWPIVNTSQGTKMILFQEKPYHSSTRVYSLPGSYLNANKNYLLDQALDAVATEKMQIFPNPSTDFTTISYSLPSDVETAKMVFYDLNGTMVKYFTIDSAFTSLKLSVFDLKSGSYYCQVESESRILSTKKLIKIN